MKIVVLFATEGGHMQEYFNMIIFGNTVSAYLIFILILIVGYIVLRLFKLIIQKSLKKLTNNTSFMLELIDLSITRVVPILFCFVFYLSTKTLVLRLWFDFNGMDDFWYRDTSFRFSI